MTVEIYDTSSSTWVDITPYIAWQGLSFSRNDVDSADAGRDMSGLMHRGRVAVKEKMTVNTIPLTRVQSAWIQTLLYPESFQVRVNPYPRTNTTKTFWMYSNNVKVSYVIHKGNGDDLETLSFPMIEN